MDSLIGEIQRHARLLRETAEWLYPLAGNTDTSGVQAQHSGGRIEAPRAKTSANIAGRKPTDPRGTKARQRKEAPNKVNLSDPRVKRITTWLALATGLDTKAKLAAKFGPTAVFEKDKPLPKAI
jgi:hypothetical protein